MPISRRTLLASAAPFGVALAQSQNTVGQTPRPAAGLRPQADEGVGSRPGGLPHQNTERAPRLKIVVTGGHPGDPECGCGGSIARYAALGHELVLLYLNRGEGYCGRSPLNQCGSIRSAEAEKACQVLRARPVFATQYDGRAIVDNPHYEEFRRLLDSEKADIVFTHWPIDKHRDHRALANLVLDAWLQGGRKFALYYYEVADDTMMFSPADFVDISGAEQQRRAACYAHMSQQPERWYPAQSDLTRRRGIDGGFAQAEGFLRHWESKPGLLP